MEMEGVDSNTSWMLGCAEKLTMRISDVNFQVHAFIVESAPFRLLLGRPFHNLLLTKLEDHEDSSVSLSIRDPANRPHEVIIPTKAHSIMVGYVSTLAFQIHPPPPPRMEAVERYLLKIPQEAALQYPKLEPCAAVFAYKKAAKKVHPVAALLPEDFRIMRK